MKIKYFVPRPYILVHHVKTISNPLMKLIHFVMASLDVPSVFSSLKLPAFLNSCWAAFNLSAKKSINLVPCSQNLLRPSTRHSRYLLPPVTRIKRTESSWRTNYYPLILTKIYGVMKDIEWANLICAKLSTKYHWLSEWRVITLLMRPLHQYRATQNDNPMRCSLSITEYVTTTKFVGQAINRPTNAVSS